jgi:hypothetical protein
MALMLEVCRVILDPDIYDALKMEAMYRNDNLKATLASMIFQGLSPKVIEVLRALGKDCPECQTALMPMRPLDHYM